MLTTATAVVVVACARLRRIHIDEHGHISLRFVVCFELNSAIGQLRSGALFSHAPIIIARGPHVSSLQALYVTATCASLAKFPANFTPRYVPSSHAPWTCRL